MSAKKDLTIAKKERPLPFDFYLPDHNLCIEFDGKQHFREGIGWVKGTYQFTFQDWKCLSKRDDIKSQWCVENDVALLRIAYTQITSIPSILSKVVQK